MWDGKFFNSTVAKYSSLLPCDTGISQHTRSDSLELPDFEDKDTAFLQNVRTILPNDTVSQNYLTQWQCVTLSWSHPTTQCPRTISPIDTVSHCSRTPESLDNSTSEKTTVPIFKQQTSVCKTVWHHSLKDCNFNVKFWSLTSILFILTWTWHCQFAITNLSVWRLVGVYFDQLLLLS
jgi:hypothetical protein